MLDDPVLRALFDEAPVGQGYWDAELRYRTVNARLAEINGIPAAEHIGRTPSELLGELGGATELRGDDPWRGEQALRDTVRAGAGTGPAELVERVEHAALVLSGGELRDDLALLAVAAPPVAP